MRVRHPIMPLDRWNLGTMDCATPNMLDRHHFDGAVGSDRSRDGSLVALNGNARNYEKQGDDQCKSQNP